MHSPPSSFFEHCPRCGHGTTPPAGPVFACAACGFHLHFNPAVAAGAFVDDGRGRILLLRRAHEPARGRLGVPGGFVDPGETAEAAARREAREETGLELGALEFLGGWPNAYEWRGVSYPVLDLYFTAPARGEPAASAPHEVDECLWLHPEEVDPDALAFTSTRAAFEAFVARRGLRPAPARRALHVVLVEPEIHWNTGNAGRTCLAAGARLHLVEPLGFSLDEREVRRAGLDYWERVEPRVWADWESCERALPDLGEVFFVSPEAPRDLWQVRYPERTVLVFGRESTGLPPRVRERHRDRLVRVPMLDPALRSVNLSTCVGIAVYEVLRQWGAAQGREAVSPAR
jgi:tRNA (cytidine/uridine-2'-O-)-methyltransferase